MRFFATFFFTFVLFSFCSPYFSFCCFNRSVGEERIDSDSFTFPAAHSIAQEEQEELHKQHGKKFFKMEQDEEEGRKRGEKNLRALAITMESEQARRVV